MLVQRFCAELSVYWSVCVLCLQRSGICEAFYGNSQ